MKHRVVGFLAGVGLLLGASHRAKGEVIYVDDPLTGSPKGVAPGVTTGSKGGTFGTSGWTVTGGDDTVWYAIPAAIPTGRIEVTMTSVSPTNLLGEEHDVLVWYGETDGAEPVEYIPRYRNNAFKGEARIFGKATEDAGGHPQGSSKMEMRLCPAGAPGHFDPCPAACKDVDVSGLAYLGGSPVRLTWEATKEYRIVIAWKPGEMSYSRGVEPTVSVTYPGTYAPKALRVRIGSPRHTATGPNAMPIGAIFKDVKVVGEPGAPTPICGETPPPDAGVPDADALPPPEDTGSTIDSGKPDTSTGTGARPSDDREGDDGLGGSCGCQVPGASSSDTPWALLVLVAVIRRRSLAPSDSTSARVLS